MNPEKELQRICESNNGTLTKEDFKVTGDLEFGAFVFISNYKAIIFHNDCKIDIIYNYGNSDTATFTVEIENTKEIPKFTLKSIDHLTKLLLFKKSTWKVQSKDVVLKRKIEELVQKYQLDTLLKNSAFQPTIKGSYLKKVYSIHTFFSLVFEGNIESMESLVEFHKGLIDCIKSY